MYLQIVVIGGVTTAEDVAEAVFRAATDPRMLRETRARLSGGLCGGCSVVGWR